MLKKTGSYTEKYCQVCGHYRDGICLIYSSECATDVFKHVKPRRFLPLDEVTEVKTVDIEPQLIPVGREIFMDVREFMLARQNKERSNPVYPDMAELTDESKKIMRRRKVKQ